MKRLFLLLVLSFIEVAINPYFLSANEAVITAAPDFNAVETVEIIPEPKEEVVISNTNYQSTRSHNVSLAVTSVVQPQNAIIIAGRTIPIEQSYDTGYVSDSIANRYGDKFIYGHNSAGVFGVLYGAGVGQTFSVFNNGVKKNYIISDIVIYEKNDANGLLQLNGSGNYMKSVSNAIKKSVSDNGQVSLNYYDLALMTCYGTMYGGGRASHRLVVFAREV